MSFPGHQRKERSKKFVHKRKTKRQDLHCLPWGKNGLLSVGPRIGHYLAKFTLNI